MHIYISNIDKEKRKATIRLFGAIGQKVDGDQFAKELALLDEQADVIDLHVNSPGGDVAQGYSVVSVMLSMKAYVNVYVVGIAASMAAVIAVCGDRVHMYDYSKLMIHDPFFAGANPDKLSDKQKKSLASVTDSLRTILSRRGKAKEEIAKLMQEETWFSADEAKAAGLADEVISTKHKEEFKGLSADDILLRVAAEYLPNNNDSMDLKKIAKELGLPDNATEADILAAIKKDRAALKKQEQDALDALLARGVKAGVVTEKNKEKMVKLAAADVELLTSLIEDAEASATTEEEAKEETKPEETKAEGKGFSRLSQALLDLRKSSPAASAAGGTEKTYDWYQKHDPRALADMEKSDPKKFEALLNAYENSI